MTNTKHGWMALALLLCLASGLRGWGAADTGLGQRPYLGWSSWSLEATKYPGYGGEAWLTAEHIIAQSDALHQKLQAHGYTYVNMDSGWQGGYDGFGRPAPDPKKFPQGIEEVAWHVHANGQKLGIYWIPGINGDLFNANPPIKGTSYHIRDIVFQPTQAATGWGFGDKIDYSKPGAQAYINSVADQFASWGVDFLKLDGVTPGSDHTDLSIDARPDVAAWAAALKQAKRPIWLELSWNLDRTYSPTWQKYAHGRRITDDVEAYGPTLTLWGSIPRAFDAARDWAGEAGPGKGWNDLDSLDIGCGEMDGLTKDERQTVMTLWAISCSPLYTGDDLTKLDADGLALLTNDEVIAVDQAGYPASPLPASEGQVWVSAGKDGSKTVALFNRDGKESAALTVSPSDLGLTGPVQVRDLWEHQDLGFITGSTTLTLAPHASRLFQITPDRKTAAAAPAAMVTATVDPGIRYQTWQGWGTSLAWWAKVVGGFPEPARTDYLDKAFDPVKGLGLNIVRYNIGGGENPQYLAPNTQYLPFRTAVPGYEPAPGVWDWNADANQRYVLNEAIKRGADQLEAFSNSPPWWMTVSGSVTGNVKGADNIKPDADAVFADYLTEVTKHFHDVWGITFRDLEPLNEPSGGWSLRGRQEGSHVDRPHQNLIVRATEAALARKGLKTTATASDEPSIGDADKTFGFYDPATLQGLTKINTHSYGGGDRTMLANFALSHGKDLWLSEDGDGDASGLSMSRSILTDINGLHPSAWVYWQVVDNAGGWGFLRSPQADETTTAYTINKKYYVMGQYSKFLRPGCRFLAMSDPNSLAAWDPKTHNLVIVTTNLNDTDAQVTYDLSKFTRLGRDASVWRTSPTENLARLAPLALPGKRFTATLPAKSVTTYVIPGAAYTGPLGFDYRDQYALVNQQTHLAADAAPGVVPSAAPIVLGERSGRSQWRLLGTGDGDYKIINADSGLALDVNQASTEPNGAIIQYGDNGGDNQHWRLKRVPNGAYTLVNVHSGLALGVSGSASGASLVQQAADGSAGQQWRIVGPISSNRRQSPD